MIWSHKKTCPYESLIKHAYKLFFDLCNVYLHVAVPNIHLLYWPWSKVVSVAEDESSFVTLFPFEHGDHEQQFASSSRFFLYQICNLLVFIRQQFDKIADPLLLKFSHFLGLDFMDLFVIRVIVFLYRRKQSVCKFCPDWGRYLISLKD